MGLFWITYLGAGHKLNTPQLNVFSVSKTTETLLSLATWRIALWKIRRPTFAFNIFYDACLIKEGTISVTIWGKNISILSSQAKGWACFQALSLWSQVNGKKQQLRNMYRAWVTSALCLFLPFQAVWYSKLFVSLKASKKLYRSLKQPNGTKSFSFQAWQITRIMKFASLWEQNKTTKNAQSGIGNYINGQIHKTLYKQKQK